MRVKRVEKAIEAQITVINVEDRGKGKPGKMRNT